jgi:hypothetical protein
MRTFTLNLENFSSGKIGQAVPAMLHQLYWRNTVYNPQMTSALLGEAGHTP